MKIPDSTVISAAVPLPAQLDTALKEWAVATRALREGRQILLLRKGGILDAGGEFEVQARDVLLFPTYLHEDEQRGSLQPCYLDWHRDESRRRPVGDIERIDAWARITHVLPVTHPEALYKLASQHIYAPSFLDFRINNEPHKPLFALLLRTYELLEPVRIPMEMDYYGCRSWITLTEPVPTEGARPVLSDRTYNERVRVTLRYLTGEEPAPQEPEGK